VTAAERWRAQLESWSIPDAILEAAPESPYGFPAELFRQRAAGAPDREPTPTARRALHALPEGGVVLDVGVGGGATSLPLAGRASTIVGVDEQSDMLREFETAARSAGVRAETVLGRWPDVETRTTGADVVVCGHVVYNVADLTPFVRALDGHAALRVVLELTDVHPLAWMADLWERFHGLERPSGPSVADVEAVLRETGVEPRREDRTARDDERAGRFDRRDAAVALVRRRLCLPADRDDEIAEAMGDRLRAHDGRWSSGPSERTVVTLWWDVRR
jgi:precorrin-6B methylase 2